MVESYSLSHRKASWTGTRLTMAFKTVKESFPMVSSTPFSGLPQSRFFPTLAATVLAICFNPLTLPLQSAPLAEAGAGFIQFESPGREAELTQLRNLYSSVYKLEMTASYSTPWFPWMIGIELATSGETAAKRRADWASALEKRKIYPDGYVSMGQHYSHAHDGGWPFPNWPQIFEPDQFRGYTAGWHFQEETESFIRLFYMEPIIKPAGFSGDRAVEQWKVSDVESEGRPAGLWKLRVTGASPAISREEGTSLLADCAPFLQLRYRSSLDGSLPPDAKVIMQWKREGDTEFSSEREITLPPIAPDPWERTTKLNHLHFAGWQHPQWTGRITGLRFIFPTLEKGATIEIDSIFTAFDTRQPVTNSGFLLGCTDFFRWTGDVGFLGRNIERMRQAMRFQRKELGGDEQKFIRVPWTGHDGLSGYVRQADGTLKRRYGVGIGNNYWDLTPFGGDDMYATTYFYASLLALAEIEEWIATDGKNIAAAPVSETAADLRKLAGEVKETANRHFWNEKTGRFIACVDREGVRHDFGYTFVNLEAIHYGLASDSHAKQILDWVTGARIVAGDTSTGADIYAFRFGPRASTLRNESWYLWAWPGMDKAWGEQVQDGGAVLGFAFHDLTSRLKIFGTENAAKRMDEMLAWLKETQAAGGFRDYFAADTSRGKLQGGGTEGGIGVDIEFTETELWPSFVLSGFVGFQPTASGFVLNPNLPDSWPSLTVRNVAFRNSLLEITVTKKSVSIKVQGETKGDLQVILPNSAWAKEGFNTASLRDGATLEFFKK